MRVSATLALRMSGMALPMIAIMEFVRVCTYQCAKGSLVLAQNKVVVSLALTSILMLCAWGQPPAMHDELYCT